MEHRLISGGEQWLPFARSSVTKLKKLGIPYASQSFVVDGASIDIRIEPGHEYIRIDGGAKILSGVIRGGAIVEVPPTGTENAYKVLRDYKPTQNAWDYPLNRNPANPTTSFNDVKFLAKVKDPTPTQYADLTPSMYSGLMAKVVAVVMGRGIKVEYGYGWDKCHGVTLDSTGKPWLVEISSARGVIAMRLPMIRGNKNSKVDAERKIIELLGGVPTGRSFREGTALEDALANGTVLTLASAVDMAPFFGKSSWASWLGWSFNPTGSEARHTCYTLVGGVMRGYLYRLNIAIMPMADGRHTGSAQLTTMEEGVLEQVRGGSIIFAPQAGDPEPSPIPEVTTLSAPDTEAPLFVRHDGNAFDVLRLRMQPAAIVHNGPVAINILEQGYSEDFVNLLNSYVVSDRMPGVLATTFEWRSLYGSVIATGGGMGPADAGGYTTDGIITYWSFTSASGAAVRGHRTCAVVEGMRDGYVFVEYGTQESAVSGYGVTNSFKEAVIEAYGPPGPASSYTQTSSTYSPALNRTYVVRPGGAPDLVYAPVTSAEEQAEEIAQWMNPPSPHGPLFTARESMFGNSAHIQHSASAWALDSVVVGPMLDGISTPTTEVFNFIGYVE